MGQTLSEPLTEKHSASCENEMFKVGSSSMQGWRVTMEDSHVHLLSHPDDKAASFFGVYDGHGGAAIAKHAGNQLHKLLVERPEYKNGDISAAFRETFLEFDNAMLKDDKYKHDVSGTTANTVLIKGNKLYCANVGDSRAVASIKGECHELSFDHKPTNPKEEKRIKDAGGWVEYNRVNGNLALSRALGDFSFKRNTGKNQKDQMVTAFPDIEERTITEDWEFIIMACDGIWDVVTNEEACEFVRYPLGTGMEPDKICEELMTACLAPDCQMGGLGCDNMTVIIICFLHGQSWTDYCSKIASTLDSSLLSFAKRISDYSSDLTDTTFSGDDDDDVIINTEASSAEPSLHLASPVESTASNKSLSPDQKTPLESLQDVMEAQDYIHSEQQGEVVVRRVASAGGSETTDKKASPTTVVPGSGTDPDDVSASGVLTGDLFSIMSEEVLPNSLPIAEGSETSETVEQQQQQKKDSTARKSSATKKTPSKKNAKK